MVIKTITCHEVYNAGASLQEFALLHYLTTLGHQSETIHYKPYYLSNHFNNWKVGNPKFNYPIIKQLYILARMPFRLRELNKKKNFDAFHRKYISAGSVLYKSNEDLKNNLPDADAYICGSDQIWNTYFQNGKDSAFYLDFVPDHKRKISYAASFATETVPEHLKEFIASKVARIDFVSVREISGLSILDDLGISNAVQVLDPVFLLEPDYWKNTFVKHIDEDYIFVYDFDSNEKIKDFVINYAKKHSCKIFTVNKNVKYADRNFYDCGPEMFLSLIYNSRLNISNSFHAVAFSIIFEKQFYVFNRKEKINTRMRDLLQILGLNEQLIQDTLTTKKNIAYSSITKQLKYEIERSKDFLKNALN